MIRTPPENPCAARQRTTTGDSSSAGVTESVIQNPFLNAAGNLLPFNRSRFAKLQNAEQRDCHWGNAGFATARISDTVVVARLSTIGTHVEVSPSIKALRSIYDAGSILSGPPAHI